MQIDYLTVKFRFVDSEVRGHERPDADMQGEIISHLNQVMEQYGAHIIDLETKASKEE